MSKSVAKTKPSPKKLQKNKAEEIYKEASVHYGYLAISEDDKYEDFRKWIVKDIMKIINDSKLENILTDKKKFSDAVVDVERAILKIVYEPCITGQLLNTLVECVMMDKVFSENLQDLIHEYLSL
jgi:hypothetical protein